MIEYYNHTMWGMTNTMPEGGDAGFLCNHSLRKMVSPQVFSFAICT